MSGTPTPRDAAADPRIDRARPWISALLSAVLHALMLALLLWAATPTVTPPQGAASGGRVRVDFVGESAQPEPSVPAPPSPTPPQPKPATPVERPRHAAPRKPVPEASYIEPPPTPQPEQRASPAPHVPGQRRPHAWTGRPPGLLEEDTALEDEGTARGPANRDGDQNDLERSEPSMEVGGYQIVYDLLGEERLRGWIAQGMKEVSIPLPGTRQRMVCPAEVALRRGSSKCRLLDPGDPELQAIGDARQVITVMYVYRRGELVWRGPGPYR
ncbi:MAG: hypothetical protein IAF01_09285 [Xanthomonadaceae bacterium]|nr:hypothetical protein [Xanthomonadaceae bacterium]MCA0198417.1 hypothetical protein [Pseudomonadota bacterium]